MVTKTFEEAEDLIEEGDILLFKGRGWGAFFLKRSAGGVYSHVGIASWCNGLLECVEFTEGAGGRIVNLETYNKIDKRQIDVYRPISPRKKVTLEGDEIREEWVDFDGLAVTTCMRKLSGLPYGWRRIWWIAKHKLAGFRLFYNPENTINDEAEDEIVYPVCSTAAAHCFNSNGFDLIKNRSDEWTEPSSLSTSTSLAYLFTLEKP